MHMQSQSKPIGFCRSRCRCNRRCLSSLFPQYYGVRQHNPGQKLLVEKVAFHLV